MALQVIAPRRAQPPVERDETCLAPAMRDCVDGAVAASSALGHDATVYETCRSQLLQQWYCEHGASHACNALRSWHIYGLAVDVISKSRGWSVWPTWSVERQAYVGGDERWYTEVVDCFLAHGLDWGGYWTSFKDTPHFQYGHCKPSPSDRAVLLYNAGGKPAVWAAVGAAA